MIFAHESAGTLRRLAGVGAVGHSGGQRFEDGLDALNHERADDDVTFGLGPQLADDH